MKALKTPRKIKYPQFSMFYTFQIKPSVLNRKRKVLTNPLPHCNDKHNETKMSIIRWFDKKELFSKNKHNSLMQAYFFPTCFDDRRVTIAALDGGAF